MAAPLSSVIQPWLEIEKAKRLNRLKSMGFTVSLTTEIGIVDVCSICLGNEYICSYDGKHRVCMCMKGEEHWKLP